MSRSFAPRLWLVRLFVAIAIGALLTVAVAWVAAGFLDITDGKLHAQYGDDRVEVTADIGAPQDWHVRSWHECWGPGVRYDMVTECEWMGSLPGMSEHTRPNRTMQRLTVGLPLPCMQWGTYRDDALPAGAEKNPWYMGLDLPGKQLIAKHVERALPLRPILWPALANVAVYTAVSYVLMAAQSAARAARRRRRGLCFRCGYLARGLATCPECGSPVQAPRPASSSG